MKLYLRNYFLCIMIIVYTEISQITVQYQYETKIHNHVVMYSTCIIVKVHVHQGNNHTYTNAVQQADPLPTKQAQLPVIFIDTLW